MIFIKIIFLFHCDGGTNWQDNNEPLRSHRYNNDDFIKSGILPCEGTPSILPCLYC